MVQVSDNEYRALIENKVKFETLFEASPDAIFLETIEGKIIDCNKMSEVMSGFSRKELLAMSAKDLVPEGIAKTFPKLIKEELTTGGFFAEALNKNKAGELFPVEVSSKLLEIGKEQFVFIVVHDISKRKKAEEALRESELRYRLLAEAANDHIFIVSADGVLQYVNSYSARIAGVSPEQVIGKKIDDFFPPRVVERAKWDLQRVVDSGEAITAEASIPFGDKERWVEARLVPIKYGEGRAKFVLGIARDMTAHKETESALRAKMKELKDFNDAAVGRELKMVDLEKEIERLKKKLAK